MRLIDADALIEALNKYKFGAISNDSEREYTREVMLCFVNGSPTSYDIEKVVAELEEKANQKWLVLAERNGYKRAIDIVRKGGVESE